jgi:hypothetical protein
MLKNAEIVSVLLTDCSSCHLVNETLWQKPTIFQMKYYTENSMASVRSYIIPQ